MDSEPPDHSHCKEPLCKIAPQRDGFGLKPFCELLQSKIFAGIVAEIQDMTAVTVAKHWKLASRCAQGITKCQSAVKYLS